MEAEIGTWSEGDERIGEGRSGFERGGERGSGDGIGELGNGSHGDQRGEPPPREGVERGEKMVGERWKWKMGLVNVINDGEKEKGFNKL